MRKIPAAFFMRPVQLPGLLTVDKYVM